MANQEHLDYLGQGIEAWNAWREANPAVQPDLSKADLSGEDLSSANLSQADLSETNLTRAICTAANCTGAVFRQAQLLNTFFDEADLSEADLSGADCRMAIFNEAQLNQAQLDGADLTMALFVEAKLQKAQFGQTTQTKLINANFSEADLSKADLSEADCTMAIFAGAKLKSARLSQADCTMANFSFANLNGAQLQNTILIAGNLMGAKLKKAQLNGAQLNTAILNEADLSGADCTGADLSMVNFHQANLTGTILIDTDLNGAAFVQTDLTQANLSGAIVYGISAWDIEKEGLIQENLRITYGESDASVTVDDLEVAQFTYLLLNNANVRNVIDTITSKAVLILGRFTPERKAILDAVREQLRRHNFVPLLFDFEKPTDRDFTETIKTLAGMSLFVIADITNPKSSPLELQATVPDYKIPFAPIIQEGEHPFSMFSDLKGKYNWVLEPLTYPSLDVLLQVFKPAIIDRAWEKHQELQIQKAQEVTTLSATEFLKKQ